MEQRRSLVLIAALALAMASLGQTRGIGPSAQTTPADASKAGQPAKPDARKPPSAPAVEEPLTALDAVAESLGVEITTDAIRRRLVREEGLTRTLPTRDRRAADAKGLLQQFVTIAHPSSVPASRVAMPSADEIGRYFAHPSSIAAGTLARIKIAVLQEAARRQATRVRFLIATLPDPIDSYTGWQFDPLLDAFVQAAAASDFIFDHAQLSDTDPHPAATPGARGSQHERESSAFVFRRHLHKPGEDAQTTSDAGTERDDGRELLVLLVVHENPSSGLHLPALLDALRLVTLWEGQPSPVRRGRGQCVAILGPTFSRSADSIAQALQLAYRRQMLDRVSRIRVLTGSATDESNKWQIEHALADVDSAPTVSFSATVQPDSVVLPALVDFAGTLGWSDRIAVLFEGDTQYGRSLGDLLARASIFGRTKPIRLPFALNVSHIRDSSQDEKLGLAQALGLPSKFRPLSMDAPAMPVDQVPQMSPETTSSYVEIGLSTQLQTMRTERVGTVALMSTDARDKLFLASRVARDSPNVSIVTVDSDSIYSHPDYAYYMQGTLVASTYALYSGTQQWSYGLGENQERHVFANGSAEGVYNAALLLLNYDSDGHPASPKAPRLADYGMPGEACLRACEPPVWISVVGSRNAWPLRPSRATHAVDYVQPVFGADTWPSYRLALDTFPSGSFVALLVAITAILMLVWLDAVVLKGTWADALFGRKGSCAPEDRWRRRAYAMVAVSGLVAIDAFLGVVWLLHLRAQVGNAISATTASHVSWFVGLTFALPLAAVQVHMIQYVVQRDRASLRPIDWRSIGLWARAAGGGLCVWAGGNFVAYLWTCMILPPAAAAAFVARATDLTSGVSPTLPIVFLFLAFVCWGVIELMRIRGQGTALAGQAVQSLLQQAVHGRLDRSVEDWERQSPSMLATPAALVWIVAIALATTCFALFDPFVRPLVTIDGVLFGRVVSSAILVLQVMAALALLQFVYLWWGLERLLDRLAHHAGADGYMKVPRGLFPARLFPQRPTFDDLEGLVECRMAYLSRSHLGGAADLERRFEAERNAAVRPHWLASATWHALLSASTMPPTIAGTVSAPGCDVVRLREMCVTLVVRDAIARLWHNMVFVIAAVLCVFSAHTLFPFRIQRALEEVGWCYVALAFGAILAVLIRMRGNELLRRIASPDPTKAGGWDTGFILRLAIFVLVPLLTLFAAQFPDAGSVMMRWVEPVRKILP